MFKSLFQNIAKNSFKLINRNSSVLTINNVLYKNNFTSKLNKVLGCNNLVINRGMANQRHKKLLKKAKGYRGRANRCYTVALQRVTKAKQYAYIGRKVSFFF